MKTLLKEIRQNPVLWLVVFVPVVFAAARLKPEAHTLLFVLAVLAIVPLAALLSHATESVAAKTGDAMRLLHPWRTQAPRAGIQPSLRPTASGLLFLATAALLIPSAVARVDLTAGRRSPRS